MRIKHIWRSRIPYYTAKINQMNSIIIGFSVPHGKLFTNINDKSDDCLALRILSFTYLYIQSPYWHGRVEWYVALLFHTQNMYRVDIAIKKRFLTKPSQTERKFQSSKSYCKYFCEFFERMLLPTKMFKYWTWQFSYISFEQLIIKMKSKFENWPYIILNNLPKTNPVPNNPPTANPETHRKITNIM